LKTLRLRVKMEKVDGRRAFEPAAIVNRRFVSPARAKFPDDVIARLTAVAVAYFIDPNILSTPIAPKKSLFLKPSTIILIISIIIIAVISLYIIKTLGFIRKI
jgi:hypothetical protein